jgi:hypothetical protein
MTAPATKPVPPALAAETQGASRASVSGQSVVGGYSSMQQNMLWHLFGKDT